MSTLAAAATAVSPSFSLRSSEETDDIYRLQSNQQFLRQQQAHQLYQNHLLALEAQSRSHTHQQQQQRDPNLSPRQMLAAQQHFGFNMQQSQQRDGQSTAAGTTPSGGWNDDSELFLRNLLASNTSSPPSSISGGSYVGSSPSYINGGSSADDNRNSLSPSSSTGFQSLHDFIHNSNFPTPPHSEASGYITNPPINAANSMDGAKSALLIQQQQQQQMMYSGQEHTHMDPNALEYFVNSMVQSNNDRPMVSSMAGLDPSLVSPMSYNQMGDTSAHGFQPFVFGPQSLPPQQYQPILQQQQQHALHLQQQQQQQQHQHQMLSQQQHPALEGRKRSAPGAITGGNVTGNKQTAATKPIKTNKKVRRQSSFNQQTAVPSVPIIKESSPVQQLQQQQQQQHQQQHHPQQQQYQQMFETTSSFMPRMEVGSNATALAAIERLKAKRRAEVELRIKQEEIMASQPKKEGVRGFKGGEDGQGIAIPAQKNQKKVAHNAIERRYRNNINDRITALRNAVPALRELRPKKPGSSRKGKGAQEQDLVDGVPAATKLNKATILGKATEYIRYLKGRETRLVSEVAGLRELIRSLEGGEELLDLWEGEMEKVVAEQEAKAKEAFAMEDESFDFGGDDDDEDEDEEDDFDVKPVSRSSSGSSASSRYMMGVFMGFSVLGGGAELMSDHHMATATTTEHAQSVVRASSGRVFGASHQLLKRGMTATNVKLGNVASVPHHFDHVPSHVLAVEVMRGVALLACLAFIFWPLVGRFITGKTQDSMSHSASEKVDKKTMSKRRREMLDALARSRPRPHEMDMSMRKFVGAPNNALHGGIALVNFVCREIGCRIGLARREVVDVERAAVWCRLLELETSLGPLAHRSLLARLHTLLTIATLSNIGGSGKSEEVSILQPARVYGTMAIAIVRAARGNRLAHVLAERLWSTARRCRINSVEQQEEDGTSREIQDRWIDSILEYSLADAIALCPPPTAVAATFSQKVDSTTRASLLAPLLGISAIQHGHHLTQIWSVLLSQIVESTCPPSQKDSTPTVAEFMKHHSDVKIFLSLAATQADQDRFSAQISRLSLTAPRCEDWQTISNVTFGTWALLIGNVSVARSVAAALLKAGEGSELPACATAFVKLVFDGNDALLSLLPRRESVEAVNEVDALAAASLTWLQFLRLIATAKNGQGNSSEVIAEKALYIRRLLASARMARNGLEEALLLANAGIINDSASSHRDSLSSTASSSPSIVNSNLMEDVQVYLKGQGAYLDDVLDTMTDILSVLGSKAALGTLNNWKREEDACEKHDSGVEWEFE